MVREAQPSDIAEIQRLGSRSLSDGPYRGKIRDNPEQIGRLAHEMLEKLNAKVFVFEEAGKLHGLFAFMVYPHPFSLEPTAQELMWYVEPEYRGKGSLELLWSAEHAARKMGALRMILTAPTGQIAKIYKHLGYEMVEVNFQAKLADRMKN